MDFFCFFYLGSNEKSGSLVVFLMEIFLEKMKKLACLIFSQKKSVYRMCKYCVIIEKILFLLKKVKFFARTPLHFYLKIL